MSAARKNARPQAADGRIDVSHSGRANPVRLTSVPYGLAIQSEGRKQMLQMMALFGQGLAGSRRLLDHGGILLGHLVHVVDGRVDLPKPTRLFVRGRCDRLDMGRSEEPHV